MKFAIPLRRNKRIKHILIDKGQDLRVYLDNNATTMVDPEAFELMKPFFCEKYGNPNSLHKFGSETHSALRRAMDQLYAAINAKDSDDIIVTSCATESNNWVAKGIFFDKILNGEKNHVIISAVEHPAIAMSFDFLKKYANLSASPLEICESLEQLRVLWHGYEIAVEVLDSAPPAGVDTVEDLVRVRTYFD